MTENPIPTCEECGQDLVRVFAVGGKGRYQCVTEGCSRKWVIRGSRKPGDANPDVDLAAMKRRVDSSYEQDADRARDSYTNHTATALRRRVLAERNGQA